MGEDVPRRASQLLEVHLAEYTALTNRCTSWLAFMVPVWAVLAAFLTIVAALWSSFQDHVALLWATGFGAQLIILIWFQTIEEQYRAIFYILHRLRPAVRALVETSDFWTYEPYSAGRCDPLSWWGEWTSPIVAVCLLISAGIYRWPLHEVDHAGLGFNVGALAIQTAKTIVRVRLRLDIARAVPSARGEN